MPVLTPTVLLSERVRRVFRELPGALTGEEDPVHQVRVAGRRLGVALPLLARKPGGRRVRKARRVLQDLVRAAGAGRDFDVLLSLYETRLGGVGELPSAQRELRRWLRAARTRSRARLTESILDLDIDGLRRRLRRVRARGTPELATILSRIRATSERDGAQVRDGLTEIGDRYDPVALHSVRRRIREVRYAAELEEALQGRTPGSSATWKALQDAIGTLHDAHLLAEWMGRRSEWAANRDRRGLSATAAAEREFFESEARRRHAELLEMKPLELVASTLSALYTM